MTAKDHFQRIKDIIHSCDSWIQLDSAMRLCENFFNRHLDAVLYKGLIKEIERKRNLISAKAIKEAEVYNNGR